MTKKLLTLLIEEIKEQGFGRYYTDVLSKSGKRLGDVKSVDLNTKKQVDVLITPPEDEVGDISFEDIETNNPFLIKPSDKLGSKFGPRNGGFHHGNDYRVPNGTNIMILKPGTIENAEGDHGGYGNLMSIRHDDGSYTRYGHLSEFNVSVGQKVKMGDVVGKTGGVQGADGAGNSSGPHLHFEYWVNKTQINPSDNNNDNKTFRFLNDTDLSDINLKDIPDTKKTDTEEDIKQNSNNSSPEVNDKLSGTIVMGDSITPHLSKAAGFNAGPQAKGSNDKSGIGLWYGGIGLIGFQNLVKNYKSKHLNVEKVVITIGTNGYGGTSGVSTLAKNLKNIFPNASLFVCQGAYGDGWKKIKPYHKTLGDVTQTQVDKFYDAFKNAGIIVVPYPIKDTVTEVHNPSVPVYKKWKKFINSY